MYDPAKSKDFKKDVKLIASKHWPIQLLKGPLKITVWVFKPTLKSFSKKKAAVAKEGILRLITKPDVDNYIKDALKQII